MKKFLIAFLLAGVACIPGYSQCDKRVIVTSSLTEYLNANNEVQRSKEEISYVEFDSKEIVITPGDDAAVTGAIKSFSCEWKTPFKEGKTVIKSTVTDPRGETFNITVTVEGKEGKLSLLLEIEEKPDRKIRLLVDKFEAKK